MEDRGKVVIFCSASDVIDPSYNEAAKKVIDALCADGYTIVSGGTVKGTMGVISEEIIKCGGRHIGIIPAFMKDLEYPDLTDLVVTETMSERKTLMRKDTIAAIALPGGIGTLDELVETYVLAKLGKYSGKVIAMNVGGFYDPLESLLDHYVEEDMLLPVDRDLIHFPTTVEQLRHLLS